MKKQTPLIYKNMISKDCMKNKIYKNKEIVSNSMKKVLIIFILSLILIEFGSASLETLKSAKINTEYTVLQTCPEATWINITLSNINGIKLSNVEMNNNGSVWEYKFNPDTLGRWDVAYLSDACEKGDTAYFEVTPSGNSGSGANIAFFILVILLIYGITLIGYLKQDYYITILGSMGMLFLGIYLFNNGIIIFRDDLTRVISYITIGLGAIISVVMGIIIIQDNL